MPRSRVLELLEFESPVGHVVAPGAALEVRVRARCAEARPVRARWIRADGTQLGGPVDLRIDAPATMTLDAVERGWVGLVFDSSDRRVAFVPQPAGFPSRAYGFAVLPPPPARRADPGSPFGMVHGRSDDPYLGPHLKSLTWHTTGARWWQREVGLRRARGMIELPIVSGDGWDSDDNRPIGSSELEALSARFRSYCAADPEVLAWELGVEENLRSTFNRRHYFPNLRAKAAAVRAVARSVRPAPASCHGRLWTPSSSSTTSSPCTMSTAARSPGRPRGCASGRDPSTCWPAIDARRQRRGCGGSGAVATLHSS